MKSSRDIAPSFLYFFLPEIGLKFNAPENLSLWTDTQRSIYQKKNTQDLLEYLITEQKNYYNDKIVHPEVIEVVQNNLQNIFSNFNENLQKSLKKRDCLSRYCELCDWYKEIDKIFSQLSSSSEYINFNDSVLDFIRGKVLFEKSKFYNFSYLKDYSYESKLESLCQKGSTFMTDITSDKFVNCIKGHIKSGIKNNPDIDEFNLSIYRLLEAYGVLYSSMSGVKKILGILKYDYNRALWNAVAELEKQILIEARNREILGLNEKQKRVPRAKRMEAFINPEYDRQKIIACLKGYIKGNKGKRVAIVANAAYQAGITNMKRIPYATLRRTFGDIGAESGYNYYFGEGVLDDEDVSYMKDKLLNRVNVKQTKS